MESKIRVIIVPPDQDPYVKEISNTLEEMQGIVDGYLEVVGTEFRNAVVVCNEEGMIHDLPKNVYGIHGTFFVANVSGSEFASLTELECKILMKEIKKVRGEV